MHSGLVKGGEGFFRAPTNSYGLEAAPPTHKQVGSWGAAEKPGHPAPLKTAPD